MISIHHWEIRSLLWTRYTTVHKLFPFCLFEAFPILYGCFHKKFQKWINKVDKKNRWDKTGLNFWGWLWHNLLRLPKPCFHMDIWILNSSVPILYTYVCCWHKQIGIQTQKKKKSPLLYVNCYWIELFLFSFDVTYVSVSPSELTRSFIYQSFGELLY